MLFTPSMEDQQCEEEEGSVRLPWPTNVSMPADHTWHIIGLAYKKCLWQSTVLQHFSKPSLLIDAVASQLSMTFAAHSSSESQTWKE